ncbi:MAG: CopD family protein [Burkholderiales bacterium]
MSIARWLHITGVVIWVGGMFFAHMALRPSVQALAPPQRLPLLSATLTRFIVWAGASVVAIVGSGIAMLTLAGGFAAVNWAIHAMTAVGAVMTLVYAYLAAVPLQRLRSAVAGAQWADAGAAMAKVRPLVAFNLALGLVTIAIAVLGRG